ncbi:MAG TPA: FGGY family carbohydrate kinase [Anaerolineae bacterium]|nr:FGGY family carbohydrate kinase [Anaerolineae bacterium]
MNYVIGCDVGSQGTKALLLSLDGELIGEAYAGYEIDYPFPLWAQQPVERWTNALRDAIRQLLHTTGVRGDAVQGLALGAQVEGVVAIDKNGAPLHPAIIWMDRRAVAQTNALRAHEDEIFQRTGLNLDATHVAPKIQWLTENEPRLSERVAHFLQPGSYVAFHLTGERAVDYSNASSTLLLDVRTKTWSPEMCAYFNINPSQLAPVGAATTPLGTLRPAIADELGLSPQTRVMIGSGDEHAACVGAGVLTPGLVGDIIGTAEPVCAASDHLAFDETHLIETHCHADEHQWLLENPGFVSGGNLRWYRDQFGAAEQHAAQERGVNAYQILDEGASQIPPGSAGLIFLPCSMGAMTPTWNDTARGTFMGFTLAHTRAHFARAILEGSAYAVRDITDRFQALGIPLRELRVMGGGARSKLWNQIKADVTGIPVAVPQTSETTALGAAFLALVGVGARSTLQEASERTVRIVERFTPNPDTQKKYDAAYALYRDTYFTLLPIFAKSSQPTEYK